MMNREKGHTTQDKGLQIVDCLFTIVIEEETIWQPQNRALLGNNMNSL